MNEQLKKKRDEHFIAYHQAEIDKLKGITVEKNKDNDYLTVDEFGKRIFNLILSVFFLMWTCAVGFTIRYTTYNISDTFGSNVTHILGLWVFEFACLSFAIILFASAFGKKKNYNQLNQTGGKTK